MRQLKEKLEGDHGIEITMISRGTKPYFADYDPKFEANLDKTVEEMVLSDLGIEAFWEGKKYLILDINCDVKGGEHDGDGAITPSIRYIL